MRQVAVGLLIIASCSNLLAEEKSEKSACVWKDDMTAAEISACRDAPPSGMEVEEQARAAERARQAENDRRNRESWERQREADKQQEAAERARVTALPNAPVVGMSAADFAAIRERDQARMTMWDWRECTVNRTTTMRGVHEQWVCGFRSARRYVYVDNGIVTAIQE